MVILNVDFSKVFDVVDDRVFRISISALISSYLVDRRKLTEVSVISRESVTGVSCSAPHISVLGPLLFIIFVNAVAAHVESPFALYVDDTRVSHWRLVCIRGIVRAMLGLSQNHSCRKLFTPQ